MLALVGVRFYFGIEAKWLTHPQCSKVIQQAWEAPYRGYMMFSIMYRLQSCRSHPSA